MQVYPFCFNKVGGNIRKLSKQDRTVPRTAQDLDKRYRLDAIAPLQDEVREIKEEYVVDLILSSTSTNAIANSVVTNELAKRVTKEEGKGLSENDFTDEYKDNLDIISKKEVYALSNYAVSGLTITRSSCILKNNRVCINFAGNMSIKANTTTQVFNIPADIRTKETKDFVVFGQNSTTTAYIGYGEITNDGKLQVRFVNDVTSLRFSTVYDLD